MIDLLGRLFAPLSGLVGGVLELFHSLGAPWWLSIVLLTVCVRALMFPLTVHQVKSVRAVQELKPEMERIRSRYDDDPREQQEAMTELYRERRVNPLAGFVPLLVQIPVLITMYHVIRNFEETLQSFANGGLLWFGDLTVADPYFILPVLSASLLLASQEISSKNVVPAQRWMMRLLPVTFTLFIARFPAGLLVYWVASNAVSLGQAYLIHRHTPPPPKSIPGEPSKRIAEDRPGNRRRKKKRRRKR